MYEVGTGKAEVTGFKKDVGMMGYGQSFNKVKRVETPLHARAYVIRHPASGKKIVFVNAEIAFITISVKRGVIKKLTRNHAELGYSLENVFLSAQHTHSGPGGYSHYGLYNFSIPGFVPEVYQAIVDGICYAILQAEKNLQPAKLSFGKGTFAPETEVAFNRSLDAYNLNPDVKKLSDSETHLAIDREMSVLRFDSLNGLPLGMVSWFGVHCTSVHNDNNAICFDNKGYASEFFEKDFPENFTAAFAQEAAGDVSPNYVWDKKKKWTRGKFGNDFESAKHNGRLQYEKAKEIFNARGENISGEIDCGLLYADFANITPDVEFTNGITDARTGSACHGVAFLHGTVEGPGMGKVESVFAGFLTEIVKAVQFAKAPFVSKERREKIYTTYKAQGKKQVIIETGERRVLGTPRLNLLIIPSFADPTIRTMKQHYKSGSFGNKPWSPQTLPLQIIIIGQLAVVAIPGEITTVAGRRLRKTILDVLQKRGVKEIILTSYSNAYSGYITTYEEYQQQRYEGGHTVYGEWTLAAFQTKFKQLALEMLKKPEERNFEQLEPVLFTDEELQKRSFPG